MESYIHLYKTNSEFTEAYNGPDYVEPWLSLTEENMKVNYNKPKLIDFSAEPLTFKISSSGTVRWRASDRSVSKTIEYKLNDGDWTPITSIASYSPPSIEVNKGDKIQFRGDNATYGNDPYNFNTFDRSTAGFEVEGNIMSLINKTNFATATTLESAYTFYSLFNRCTGLTSAENLILPSTTVTSNCYSEMFYGCTSLKTAPSLPATELAYGCYNRMFYGCSGLTTVPSILPSITLVRNCYEYMFCNCKSLTTAPVLPATTLTDNCYEYMFGGCAKLNYIKCLATDVSATKCTNGWVDGVASTGTFVKAGATEWTTGISGIPTNWDVKNA